MSTLMLLSETFAISPSWMTHLNWTVHVAGFDQSDVFSVGPSTSTFHLGTLLPHKEVQVLLLDTADTWRHRPWRTRDHRLKKKSNGGPWCSTGQQAPGVQRRPTWTHQLQCGCPVAVVSGIDELSLLGPAQIAVLHDKMAVDSSH